MNIDTTTPQYMQLLAGVPVLRSVLGPRFKIFVKLSRDKQKAWLNRDPLLAAVVYLYKDMHKQFQGGIND